MAGLSIMRKVGQSVSMGTGRSKVKVRIAHVDGDRVSLKIEADRSVPILREELETAGAQGRPRPGASVSGGAVA